MTSPPALLFFSITAVVIVVVAWAGPRVVFTFEIRIRDGRARIRSGRTRMGFLGDVQEIVDRNDVRRGRVRGLGRLNSARLSFAGPIPPNARQQMRNAWNVRR